MTVADDARDAADAAISAVVTAHRSRLVAVAYRLLGEFGHAEDAVQEATLRLHRHGLDGIEDAGAWLHRVTTRICLDRLRSAAARRERYVGPWLPEPVTDPHVADPSATGPAPAAPPTVEDTVELAESVSMAFLVVLESLSPAERVAFVLNEVFGVPHREVAATLDRSEEATRQLLHRARRHVAARRPRFEIDPQRRAEVAGRFLVACASGELTPLVEVLAPEVVLVSDGGGVVSAARRPVTGADAVARFLLGVMAKDGEAWVPEVAEINGAPGVVLRDRTGTPTSALAVHVADGRIHQVSVVRNPAKLAHLAAGPHA